jgi:hypothetical protein
MRPLRRSLDDLRSRLVFLWAIIGKHREAAELADQLREGDVREDWLAVYNRALLTGISGGWVRAAEELADLETPLRLADVQTIYLLLHCPGIAVAPARPASHYFARVPLEHVGEVVLAQRLSLEAMSRRHDSAGYLAHLHSLQVPAARRIAAWTLATKYQDVALARTLLQQLVEADAANQSVYRADIEELRGTC